MDSQPASPTDNHIASQFEAAAPPPIEQPQQSLPAVPTSWPGAFAIYKNSRDAVRINILPLVVFYLLNIGLTFLLQWKLGLVGNLLSYIVSGIAITCTTLLFLGGVRRQQLSLGETLNKSLPIAPKMIFLQILLTVSYILSILLLIIPFFFVFPQLALAPYYLVDKNMGVLEAYKASWAATKGNVGKIWGIYGATFAMAMLFFTVIGIPFAIYFVIMYSAATVILYEFINKQNPNPLGSNNTPVVPEPGSPAAPPPPVAPPPASQLPPSPVQ